MDIMHCFGLLSIALPIYKAPTFRLSLKYYSNNNIFQNMDSLLLAPWMLNRKGALIFKILVKSGPLIRELALIKINTVFKFMVPSNYEN